MASISYLDLDFAHCFAGWWYHCPIYLNSYVYIWEIQRKHVIFWGWFYVLHWKIQWICACYMYWFVMISNLLIHDLSEVVLICTELLWLRVNSGGCVRVIAAEVSYWALNHYVHMKEPSITQWTFKLGIVRGSLKCLVWGGLLSLDLNSSLKILRPLLLLWSGYCWLALVLNWAVV